MRETNLSLTEVQKCAFCWRKCRSEERLGMHIFFATLGIIVGAGHNWEAASSLMPGASVWSSEACTESGGASHGSSNL